MAVGVMLFVIGASAQPSLAQPAPVTDFASYPSALPASCATSGPGVVQGASYTVNGRSAADLGALDLVAGDTVTMTWDSFTPGCETVGVGLSVKIAYDVTFDPNDDQYLASFDYCGPEGPLCAAPYQLQVQLLPGATAPCWQVDAHLGPPLSIVGPSGAYYSLNSPQNMLISANNGGTQPCTPEPCPENPSVPAGSMTCRPVTATTAGLPPPTEAPTTLPSTTAPPQVVPTSAAQATTTTTCPEGMVLNAAGQCVAQSSTNVLGVRQALPATGSSNDNLLLAALGLVMFGGALVLLAIRRPAVG